MRVRLGRPLELRARLRRLALAALPLLLASAATAEADLASRIQAAYIYKFLGFVRWPPDAPLAEGSVRVGFAAGEALATALQNLGERRVGALPIDVRPVADGAEVGQCRVLVVEDPGDPKSAALLAGARGQPVLTVATSGGFPAGSGIVRFVLVDDTVRFEVDLAAAKRAGLEIDSRLLGVATVVHRGPAGGP